MIFLPRMGNLFRNRCGRFRRSTKMGRHGGRPSLATGTTFVIVIVTKFAEGAWLVVIVIPALFFLMHRIKRHYLDVAEEIAISGPILLEPPKEIIVVLLVDHLNSVTQKGLQIA